MSMSTNAPNFPPLLPTQPGPDYHSYKPEYGCVDGFTFNSRPMNAISYFQNVLTQLEPLRRANGYRLRMWGVPPPNYLPILAFESVEYQVQCQPGSYLWGFNFWASAENGLTPINAIRIVDACTQLPMTSNPALAVAYAGTWWGIASSNIPWPEPVPGPAPPALSGRTLALSMSKSPTGRRPRQPAILLMMFAEPCVSQNEMAGLVKKLRSPPLCPKSTQWTPTLDRAGVMRFNRGPLNKWDALLFNEKISWAAFISQNPPTPYVQRPGAKYHAPPWIAMPAEAKRFNRVGTLPVANNFTGLDTPSNTRAPPPSSSVIMAMTGSLPKSSSRSWPQGQQDLSRPPGCHMAGGVDYGQALNTALYYFRDYGQVQTTTGDITGPTQLYNNGLRFISNQALNVYVNLAIAASNRINPSATILGVLGGWTWPR